MHILYSKQQLDRRDCALKVTDCIYTKEQFLKFCEGDFKKLFPQYDPEQHIVHDGDPLSFPVADNGVVREMTDSELAISKNRTLKDGEKVENGVLTYTAPPEDEGVYKWHNGAWVTERDYGIATGSITLETEKEKARLKREKDFNALDLYDKAVLRSDVSEGTQEKQARDQFRADWLTVPNTYEDLTQPIESLYPTMPDFIKYFV